MAEIDRFARFTEPARKVLQLAWEETQRFNHSDVGPEHLLLGMARDHRSAPAFQENLGVDLNTVRRDIEDQLGRGPSQSSLPGVNEAFKRTITLAVDSAVERGDRYFTIAHMAEGLARLGEGTGYDLLMKYCQARNVDPREAIVTRIRELEAQAVL